MNKISNLIFGAFAIIVFTMMASCGQADGNDTGDEFVPDMAHSIANEANIINDYNLNTWDTIHGSSVTTRFSSMPRKTVSGTVPRGAAAVSTADIALSSPMEAVQHTIQQLKKKDSFIPMTENGAIPYYFSDTDSGRIEATNKLLYNPYPITAEGLEKGKFLYNTFCGICHGEKGDGNGWLVDEANPYAAYPAAPAILINEEFTAASNGRFYHAIVYGKNVMGGYADKVSYEERWQIIHWIRALQAKETKTKYNEKENTLNASFGVPMAAVKPIASSELMDKIGGLEANELNVEPSNAEEFIQEDDKANNAAGPEGRGQDDLPVSEEGKNEK